MYEMKEEYYTGIEQIREFDSLILEKVLAGRITPAFFVSTFSFCYIVFYCNVW